MSEPQAKATLELITQKEKKSLWSLEGKNTFKVGRGKNNEVVLPFSWISRQHAMLQREGLGFFNIIDLGSSNGTLVNDRRIYTPTRLNNNDRITIGDSILVFNQEAIEQTSRKNLEDDLEDATVAFLQTELVTILICDIRSYTTLSEELGHKHISRLLSYWTKKVSSIVKKNGGHVDKFIGDAVMAVWKEKPDCVNIINALKTAVEICIFSSKLGEKIPFLKRKLHIGAALNTGEAVRGNMGDGGQREYTVVGDVVNVTFRLEDMTVPNQFDVIIGDYSFNHLPDASSCFKPRKYMVKGKTEEVKAHGCTFKALYKYLKILLVAK